MRAIFAVAISALAVTALSSAPNIAAAQQKNAVQRAPSKVSASSNGLGLLFQRAGTVTAVLVRRGSKVQKGQALVQLDTAEAAALLDGAQADLDVQRARLGQLQTASDVDPTTAAAIRVRNATEALLDAKRSIISILQDGYVKADDAVHNRADQLFMSARSAYPQIILPGIDQATQDRLAQQRAALEIFLSQWKASLDGLTIDSDLVPALDTGANNLSAVRDFLNTLAQKLNNAASDNTTTALTLRNWRSDIYTARTNVSTSIKDVLAVRAKEREAENTLALQKASAAGHNAPSAIALQLALVNQAEAKRKLQEIQLAQLTLRAPANGVIVSVEIQPGAAVRPGTPALHFMRFVRAEK